jgi:subtilisin family serine protease
MKVHIVRVPEGDIDGLLDALRHDPAIQYAEPDGIAQSAFVPNDPSVTSGVEWHLAKVQAPQAWDITHGDTNLVIAILDSGINGAHPDLSGRIVPGFNFVSGTTDTTDDFGHGTAVAGVALAAGNNSVGVAGVAFGCSILPVKVVNGSGFAYYSTIADGIHYAVDQGARVINISIAGSSPSITLQEAVDYAWSNNVIVVAAAGNNSTSDPQYPAACDHVVAVSATEPDDSLAPFSSFGSYVSLSAPGDNIWTTQRDLADPYGSWRGTSFASPLVAAVAGLVASANPALSNGQIVSLIETAADDIGAAGNDLMSGYGRVNALQSVLRAAASPAGQPAPAAPPGTAVLTYQIIGPGRVVPDLNGRPLPLGQTCRLKAVPAPGQVFGEWDGLAGRCSAADLEFLVESNMNLVASFAPSPYSPFKGAYAGLIMNTNEVTTENSGYLRLNLSGSGRFTGRLTMGSYRAGFSGGFNSVGDAQVTIRRSTAILSLTLHLDVFRGDRQLTGILTSPDWASDLVGFRNIFNAHSNPAPQTGSHAFILDETNAPASTNTVTGLIRVHRGGSVYSHGRIGGERPFGSSTVISETGGYPFYVSRNRGDEILIGWLNVSAGPSAPSGIVFRVTSGTEALETVLQARANDVVGSVRSAD